MEQRKLKEEAEETLVVDKTPSMPKSKMVRTANGSVGIVDPDGFDFSSLDGMKGYLDGDVLDEPEIKTNKKGMRFLKKAGAPKYYFNKNELIKVYRGLGGKKRSLFWIYNDKKALDKKIRMKLRQMGIPGA